jgi:hypothetical protein
MMSFIRSPLLLRRQANDRRPPIPGHAIGQGGQGSVAPQHDPHELGERLISERESTTAPEKAAKDAR